MPSNMPLVGHTNGHHLSADALNQMMSLATTENAIKQLLAVLNKKQLTQYVPVVEEYLLTVQDAANAKSTSCWSGEVTASVGAESAPVVPKVKAAEEETPYLLTFAFAVTPETQYLRGYTFDERLPEKEQGKITDLIDEKFNEWLGENHLKSENGFISDIESTQPLRPDEFLRRYSDENQGFLRMILKNADLKKKNLRVEIQDHTAPELKQEPEAPHG